jgi:hypothetical protein
MCRIFFFLIFPDKFLSLLVYVLFVLNGASLDFTFMVPAIRLSSYQNPILECTARPAHSQPLPTTGATAHHRMGGGGSISTHTRGLEGKSLFSTLSQNRGHHKRGGGRASPKQEGWKENLYPLTKQGSSQTGGEGISQTRGLEGESLPSHRTGASTEWVRISTQTRGLEGESRPSHKTGASTEWGSISSTHTRRLEGESLPSHRTGASTEYGSISTQTRGLEGNLYPLTETGAITEYGVGNLYITRGLKGKSIPSHRTGTITKEGEGGHLPNKRAGRGICTLSYNRISTLTSTGAITGWGCKPPNQKLSKWAGRRISTHSQKRGHQRKWRHI